MKLKRRYVFSGIAVTLVVFLGGIWASPFPLVSRICLDTSIPLSERWSLSVHLLSSSFSDVPSFEMVYLATIAILIGINTSLVLAYVRMRRDKMRATGVASGLLGTLAGLLGLGCAACGTFVLSPLLVTIGAGGLIASLPFGGEELKYIGIILLLLSAYLLARDLNKPSVCAV